MWRTGIILPNNAPLDVHLTADAVTICLENQKNGHKNAVLHHTSSNDATMDPVKSEVMLIKVVRSLPENTPVGTIVDDQNRILITSDEIHSAIQIAATYDNLPVHGYSLSCISSHSISSGVPVVPCISNWLDMTTTSSKNSVVGPAIHTVSTFKPKSDN
jgi:hypothetical protein